MNLISKYEGTCNIAEITNTRLMKTVLKNDKFISCKGSNISNVRLILQILIDFHSLCRKNV